MDVIRSVIAPVVGSVGWGLDCLGWRAFIGWKNNFRESGEFRKDVELIWDFVCVLRFRAEVAVDLGISCLSKNCLPKNDES